MHDQSTEPAPDAHLSEAPLALAQTEPRQSIVAASSPVVDLAMLQPNEAAGYLMLNSDNWKNLVAQCEMMVRGRALPQSIATPAQAAQIALKGIEMGIPLSSAWSGMRIIAGEVTVLGKLALRLIQQRALPKGAVCRRLPVEPEERKLKAGWEMGRPGETPEPFWYTFENAREAGLLRMKTKDGEWIDTPAYKKYPERMLPWRALAYGAAYIFADILQGCLITEEMSHKDPEWLHDQAVEAGKAQPDVPSEETSAQRNELDKTHPRARMLKDRVRDQALLILDKNPRENESPEQKEERFSEVRGQIWDELLGSFVPAGCRPTLEEVDAMIRHSTIEIDRLRRK